jgi:hypothetical protein
LTDEAVQPLRGVVEQDRAPIEVALADLDEGFREVSMRDARGNPVARHHKKATKLPARVLKEKATGVYPRSLSVGELCGLIAQLVDGPLGRHPGHISLYTLLLA